MRNIQQPKGDDNLVDTDTDPEHVPVHDTKEVANKINRDITTVISDNRQYKELNDGHRYYNYVVEAQR